MDAVLKYMELARPFDLTIITSAEYEEVIVRLCDLQRGKVSDMRIALYEVHFSERDLIEIGIKLVKDDLMRCMQGEVKMKARLVGRDGSMGFENGKIYKVRT